MGTHHNGAMSSTSPHPPRACSGQCNDVEQTASAIVEASATPLSVIIIGVGAADFSAMEFLDSDDSLLKDTRGRVAERDIVQFVPFRKFSGDSMLQRMRLASEVLAELPDQVTNYFAKRCILPGAPQAPLPVSPGPPAERPQLRRALSMQV